MAYIKYKELSKYFNFNGRIPTDNLPKYITDYLDEKEEIIIAYKTRRDKGIFTNKRMILFDVTPFTASKKVHIMPYKTISSALVQFDLTSSSLVFTFESGYQLKLNFNLMKDADKTDLRTLFTYIMEKIS